jgi:hypothetical protein
MLIFIMAGCSDKPKYEIKDAGMNALEGSIHWMDNETLIFVNWDYRHIKSIYTWNTVTNKLKLHRENIDSNICYSDGYITYRSRDEGGKIFHRSGMFPNEEEYSADQIDKKSKFNRYSCKRFIPPEEHKDKHIHYLREGDGYLYIGTTIENNEYIQYVNQEGDNTQLQIKGNEYRHPNGFYDFKNAYFIWGVRGASSTWGNRCQSAWWLYTNAKTEKMCVPLIDEVINGSVLIYPFKLGYLFVSHGRGGRNDAGNSGIYLLDLKMEPVQKLISGQANGIAISPDGCQAAFRHNSLINKTNHLKTIQLCNNL